MKKLYIIPSLFASCMGSSWSEYWMNRLYPGWRVYKATNNESDKTTPSYSYKKSKHVPSGAKLPMTNSAYRQETVHSGENFNHSENTNSRVLRSPNWLQKMVRPTRYPNWRQNMEGSRTEAHVPYGPGNDRK